MKVKREREVAQLCPTLKTPWTAAYQAPPSMGFSRQEDWSGVPLPSPPESLGTEIEPTPFHQKPVPEGPTKNDFSFSEVLEE